MRKAPTPHNETSLAELIDDPLVHAVMARDGVSLDELVEILREAKERLALAEPA